MKITFPFARFHYSLLLLIVFSIAMAFMESAVVIYLREVLYPKGFMFPLVPISNTLAITEIIREVSTIIMLVVIGIFTGRTNTEKFAMFLLSFALWDIFYYVFLKSIIDWPVTIFTWDVLFLIPVTWTSPVIAPIIVSMSMIALAGMIIYFTTQQLPYFNAGARINPVEWLFFIGGSLAVILAFVWDYSRYILSNYQLKDLWNTTNRDALFNLSLRYEPQSFPWGMFLLGEVAIIYGIFIFFRRNKNNDFY